MPLIKGNPPWLPIEDQNQDTKHSDTTDSFWEGFLSRSTKYCLGTIHCVNKYVKLSQFVWRVDNYLSGCQIILTSCLYTNQSSFKRIYMSQMRSTKSEFRLTCDHQWSRSICKTHLQLDQDMHCSTIPRKRFSRNFWKTILSLMILHGCQADVFLYL